MADFTKEKISVSPAFQFVAITPDDDHDLTVFARALFVGTGGNVEVYNAEGEAIVFKNVPDGTFLPVNTARVLARNTTASDIVAIH